MMLERRAEAGGRRAVQRHPESRTEQRRGTKGGPGEKRPLSHRSRESRASSRRPVRLGASRLRVVGAPSRTRHPWQIQRSYTSVCTSVNHKDERTDGHSEYLEVRVALALPLPLSLSPSDPRHCHPDLVLRRAPSSCVSRSTFAYIHRDWCNSRPRLPVCLSVVSN